ncbi:putative N-acetyltransferase camello [Glandiceps talaboti]
MTSKSNLTSDKGKVVVREFTTADEERAKALFRSGMTGHTVGLVEASLHKVLTWIILTSAMVMSWWFSQSISVVFVTALVLMLLVYLLCYCVFTKYCSGRLSTDLKDIKKYYMDVPRHYFWVGEHNGKLVGTVSLRQAEKDVDTAELMTMSVDKECRHLGIGGKLVNAVIEFAIQNNYRKLILETLSIMKPARRLYERKGFKLSYIDNTFFLACPIDICRYSIELCEHKTKEE